MDSAAIFGIILFGGLLLLVLFYTAKFITAAIRYQRRHAQDSEVAQARLREFEALSARPKPSEETGESDNPSSAHSE